MNNPINVDEVTLELRVGMYNITKSYSVEPFFPLE